MSNDIAPASPPPGALRERDGADWADPRIARAEQRLAMLRELSDLGMAMTRRLARRALETPDVATSLAAADPAAPAKAAGGAASARPAPSAVPGPRHDPADSFAKLSRAIRLTVALETRTDDDLAALRAGGPRRAAPGPVDRADREAGDGCDAEDAETFDDYDYDYDDHDQYDERSVPPPRDASSGRRDGVRDPRLGAIHAEAPDVHWDHEGPVAPDERPTEGVPHDADVNGPLGGAARADRDPAFSHPGRDRWTGEDWAAPPPDTPRHRRWSGWAPEPGRTERRQQ
jgi:hypothetical protein